MPVIAMMCITGSIYLFKSNFNNYVYQQDRFVSAPQNAKASSYSDQLNTAKAYSDHKVVSVTLPNSDTQSTGFRQKAESRASNIVYVNPYTNRVSGTYEQRKSLMYTVRKLHGEMLLGTPGTLFIELVASWFIVLALTGIYVWWPARGFSSLGSSFKGFFAVRTKQGRRTFWRDMHSVLAFWMSLFMLIILAGGMPWTDVFGDNLQWVQKQTNSGYPQHWRNSKGLSSNLIESSTKPISLDQVVTISEAHQLKGEITIKLPSDDTGVYTVSNRALWLNDQRVIHIDQYSGDVIKALRWSQVGIMADLQQVFMRLHQGEYGTLSLIAVLIVALTFFVATLASIISYLIRRPKGKLGLPQVPENFKVALPLIALIAMLGLLFPVFGISVVFILIVNLLISRLTKGPATL